MKEQFNFVKTFLSIISFVFLAATVNGRELKDVSFEGMDDDFSLIMARPALSAVEVQAKDFIDEVMMEDGRIIDVKIKIMVW